jgi:hypothetical protein
MTRTLPFGLAVLLAVVTLAMTDAAGAQAPGQDSVIGTGANELFTFDFSARSGPSGENPSGQVELVNQPGFPFFSGPVTCLSVQGNVALMNVQTSVFGLLLLRVTDNTPAGLADRVEADFATTAPTECSTAPAAFLFDQVIDTGDIVITDAPPLPTSKDQCKNGGWRNFAGAFKNQGQCVAFVERGPKP